MIELLKTQANRTMIEGAMCPRIVANGISVMFLLALLCTGCSSGDGTRGGRINAEEGQRVFSSNPAAGALQESTGDSSQARGAAGWGILLEHFTGAGHMQSAERRAGELGGMLGRGDVRVIRKQDGSAVVMGSYAGPGDQHAIRDLQNIHAFTQNGRRPFVRAFLTPPPTITDPGQVPELSLQSARRRYGSKAEYTLQIGVYESSNQFEAKRAAEQAALRLRGEGELAFYHHGQHRSMVTIGVFGPQDYHETRGIRNPQLIALKNRYPLNLLNGQYPIIVKRPGMPDVKQRSMLVKVPE